MAQPIVALVGLVTTALEGQLMMAWVVLPILALVDHAMRASEGRAIQAPGVLVKRVQPCANNRACSIIKKYLGGVMKTTARACLLIALGFFSIQVQAKTASEVFAIASKSVVVVYGLDAHGKKQTQGSGVILPNGDIATNCHVIDKSSRIEVMHQGRAYKAKSRDTDWDRDICTLTPANLKASAAILGSTKGLKVGARVYAIGAPKGLELTLSEGIVSSLREVEKGHYIQTTAPISPGSSGGGLFDEEGRLMGLPTFYLAEGQQLNFAVPVEWIDELPKRHSKQRNDEQTDIAFISQSILLEWKKDWTALLNLAQRRTIVRPRDDGAWFVLGVAYANTGQLAEAIDAYQQSLDINPEKADGWNNLGLAYKRAKQTGKALDAYKQALLVNSDYAGAWLNIGVIYAETDKAGLAQYAFDQALRINPGDEDAWLNKGIAYRIAGQPDKAIESLEQVIRKNPDHAGAWYNLGLLYKNSKQLDKANNAYRQVIRINPDHFFAWRDLGFVYGLAGDTKKSIEAFQQAVGINPDDVQTWEILGISYLFDDNRAGLMDVYRRLKRLDPATAEKFFTMVKP